MIPGSPVGGPDTVTSTILPRKVYCPEKCILYSGLVASYTDQEVTVISGTVFQQLVVWNVRSRNGVSESKTPSQQQTQEEGQIVARLEGHEGVIFSVQYKNGVIVSTSGMGGGHSGAIMYSMVPDCAHGQNKNVMGNFCKSTA